MHQKELYNISQIRALEKMALEQMNCSEYTLMQSAGRAAYDFLAQQWPQCKNLSVFCGQGNNGGDGLVMAFYAKAKGINVSVYYLGHPDNFSSSASTAWELCQQEGVELIPYSSQVNFSECDVIVDALLGIGLHGEVTPLYQEAIELINRADLPVLAIDVPSGLEVDTGTVFGKAVQAESTVTFIGLKQGLFTNDGPDHAGTVHLASLDIPEAIYATIPPSALLLSPDLLSTLPCRPKNANKGQFGHVLIIGGAQGMGGAVRLAAEAALRVGAGLVSVACSKKNAALVCAHYPEIMCHEIKNPEDLVSLLSKATVLVVGPGLGQEQWGVDLMACALASELPTVIDADALNLLGSQAKARSNWILTPHPGEAMRLLGWEKAQQVQANRFEAINCLARKGGTWVLKGAGSLVIDEEQQLFLCPFGNPGMASGGMGDALSGIIAGLLAQKLSLSVATRLGVLIHALAGDDAAKKGVRGMVASDLIAALRTIVNG